VISLLFLKTDPEIDAPQDFAEPGLRFTSASPRCCRFAITRPYSDPCSSQKDRVPPSYARVPGVRPSSPDYSTSASTTSRRLMQLSVRYETAPAGRPTCSPIPRSTQRCCDGVAIPAKSDTTSALHP